MAYMASVLYRFAGMEDYEFKIRERNLEIWIDTTCPELPEAVFEQIDKYMKMGKWISLTLVDKGVVTPAMMEKWNRGKRITLNKKTAQEIVEKLERKNEEEKGGIVPPDYALQVDDFTWLEYDGDGRWSGEIGNIGFCGLKL